jgi:hypothetical protein
VAEHLIEERYDNHRGINPKANDLTRDRNFASGMLNAQYSRDSGAVEKRKGYQGHAAHVGGYGLFTYNRIDPTTEDADPEVLAIDKNLHTLTENTFTVAYAGAATNCTISILYIPDEDEYKCQIVEGTSTVLDESLGIGFDEASPITLANLKTAIDAVTGFSATITGTTSTPAAFLKSVRNWDLSSATGANFVGVAKYWTQVNSTVTNPFNTSYTNRNDENWENVSAQELQNCIYFANGYTEIYKYDGQTFYRAGVPSVASLTSALGAAGNPNGTNYYHRAQYIQYDAAGNIVEGNLAITASGVNAVNQRITVTVANIQASTGFNTNCAVVAGAQAGVTTITVDNGSGGSHTMKVGDTAYFYDSVTADYIERSVTAVSGTTITISGANVTVADNDVISNNLRIAIYRNKTAGSTPSIFYLVAEIPNNSFAATQAYTDNLADASLGALLIPPITDRSPPPKGKYLASFQNSLIIAGNPTYRRRLYWSDIDGPEYFPTDTNQQDVETISGETLVGIAPSGTVLAIFTNRTTSFLSGTIGDNNIRIETKAYDIGCDAHASIIQVEGFTAWWSGSGPYFSINGQMPEPLGKNQDGAGRLENVMVQDGMLEEEIFKPKRIVAFNWAAEQKALWFLPAESEDGSNNIYPNSNSVIYAYDYTRDAWLKWNNINMAAGAVNFLNETYFQERRYSSFATAIKSIFYRFHNSNDAFDYQDNAGAISWEYDTAWEALGKPSVLKRFLEVKLYSLEEIPNNEFTVTVTQEINYRRDTADIQFTIDFTGVGYGQSAYGTAGYGDTADGTLRHDMYRNRIRSTRLRFSNSEEQANCLISAWEFLIAAPYRPEFKL